MQFPPTAVAIATALVVFAPPVHSQLTPDEQNTISVFKRAAPAVVHVKASRLAPNVGGELTASVSTGSGFLIDGAGHVLTNYHVIEGSTALKLFLAEGQELDAQLVGTAPAFDVALLKARLPTPLPDGLLPLPLGDSEKVEVGQKVMAIGNPLGFHNTLTVGAVSGLARDIPGTPAGLGHAFLQTDAAINPGNSGGPLLDSAGRVVGINTLVAREGQNIGFAIPINLVKKALPDLMRMGHVYRPLLGFSAVPITLGMATLFGLPVRQGLLIQEVVPGSPGALAGLRAGSRMVPMNDTVYVLGGDIVVAIDGNTVSSPLDLSRVFLGAKPGDVIRLMILRDERRQEIAISLPPMHLP